MAAVLCMDQVVQTYPIGQCVSLRMQDYLYQQLANNLATVAASLPLHRATGEERIRSARTEPGTKKLPKRSGIAPRFQVASLCDTSSHPTHVQCVLTCSWPIRRGDNAVFFNPKTMGVRGIIPLNHGKCEMSKPSPECPKSLFFVVLESVLLLTD